MCAATAKKIPTEFAICGETARHRSMIQLESSPPLETHRPAVSSIIIHLERSSQIQHIKMTEHPRLHDLYKMQRKNFGIIFAQNVRRCVDYNSFHEGRNFYNLSKYYYNLFSRFSELNLQNFSLKNERDARTFVDASNRVQLISNDHKNFSKYHYNLFPRFSELKL